MNDKQKKSVPAREGDVMRNISAIVRYCIYYYTQEPWYIGEEGECGKVQHCGWNFVMTMLGTTKML